MSDTKPNPDQLAEQYGSNIGHNALNAILAAPNQAARLAILEEAIVDVSEGGNKHSIAGFSVALVNVIERGLGLTD